jgi:hypothetical protein
MVAVIRASAPAQGSIGGCGRHLFQVDRSLIATGLPLLQMRLEAYHVLIQRPLGIGAEQRGERVPDGAARRVVRQLDIYLGAAVGIGPEPHDASVSDRGALDALPGDDSTQRSLAASASA